MIYFNIAIFVIWLVFMGFLGLRMASDWREHRAWQRRFKLREDETNRRTDKFFDDLDELLERSRKRDKK